MPTRERLESALRNAHGAGDTAAAKQLANALKAGQFEAAKPEGEPATLELLSASAEIQEPEDLSILVAQRHAARSPRVLRTHLHAYACRIYAASFRASTGL